MRIGFTGSRLGMTGSQVDTLFAILHYFGKPPACFDTFHHGDCIGSDVQAFNLARNIGYKTIAHPGNVDPRLRAYTASTEVWETVPPLERNKVIVDLSDVMLAAPHSIVEELRSGTWATVRYARKRYKDVNIIEPSGAIHGPLETVIDVSEWVNVPVEARAS